jgi:hypothetical protein
VSRFLKTVPPELLDFQLDLMVRLIRLAVDAEREAASEVSDGVERLVARTLADAYRTAAGTLMSLAGDTQFDLRTEAEARCGMTLTGVVAGDSQPTKGDRRCR